MRSPFSNLDGGAHVVVLNLADRDRGAPHAAGKFIWPGFGENMRVLKWIVDRCHSRTDAQETALGWVPGPNSLDLTGLDDFTNEQMEQAQAIREEEWRREITMQDELFMKIHARLPKELIFQRELLLARL